MKKRTPDRHVRSVFLRKFLVIIYLLCFTLWLHAAKVDSTNVVTFSVKSESLNEALIRFKDQTGVQILFNEQLLANKMCKELKLVEVPLETALNKMVEGSGFVCTKVDGVYVIKKSAGNQGEQRSLRRITGVVTDPKGESLPGVSVIVKGTTLGTSTDIDGKFVLDLVQEQQTLVFTMVGMESREFVLSGDKEFEELNVVLQYAVSELDDVVVTGIFTKSRESYTGAVTTITAKDLQKVGNRNILASIRNIDPSFNITDDINIGSDPNKLPDITVRGSSALDVNVKDLQTDSQNQQSVNQPLFIMDGFEISLERMMDLDDNQIESITLLKDASATAMYGTRGANGVVVITTSKPGAGKLRLTYKGSINIEAPDLSSYNLLNAEEKLQYESAAGLYESASAINMQKLQDLYNQRLLDVRRGVDTYWLKYPVRTGVGHKHSLRMEGGDDIFRYAVGLAYNHVVGAMKGSERNTFNGNVFFSYQYKNLTFQNDLQISANQSQNSPYGSFNTFGKVNAYWTPYDETGNLIKLLEDYQYSIEETNRVYNPLYNALLPSLNKNKYTQIQNNFAIEWKILPELLVRGRLGITSQTSRGDIYKSAKHTDFENYTGEDYDRKGTYSYSTGEAFNYEADFTLNYSKTFRKVHQLYVGTGFNFAQAKSEDYSILAEGISNVNADFLGMASKYEKDGRPYGTESISRRLGGILNANYTFDRRYFIDLSGKIEGSSKFGSENRYAPFWSAGIGWNLHNETFWGERNIFNMARLRLSYGTSGAQAFSPYQAMTTFKDYGGKSYQGWYGVYLMAMGNPDLGWQKTGQIDVGMELELFHGRIRLNADYYKKVTNDLLSDINLPSSSGFESYKANVGKVENQGIEFSLNAYLIRNTEKSIIWTVGGTLAHNRNRILAISNSLEFLNEQMSNEAGGNPSFMYKEGQSMNTIFAVRSLGIDPSNGREIYVKKDGTQTYTWDSKDKVPCGVEEPKVWGNLNTMFRYKGFTFNAVFGYRLGGQMYNYTLVSKVENIRPFDNADKRVLYDRWKNPGDKAFFKGVRDFTTTNASSRFVMDENTLECRSISLGYDWDSEWMRKAGVSYLTLTGYMEDVFHLSTIRQERGLNYPFARKFSLALTLRF